MTSKLLLGLFVSMITLAGVGCTYNSGHDHGDRHSRDDYHVERGGHYGGWDRHDRRCD